ncbi:hypothetical protein RclHR1_04100008 [Rhizophagus clarus]|uniref:Uncharacterized protein n=1 Tax=Rhizophagus clarus TaxID=94130 RepID=A0A2Z6RXR9_9GLOM|nr:hypothetical protein RclHR1_04100008 [Rhizophagus clarus]
MCDNYKILCCKKVNHALSYRVEVIQSARIVKRGDVKALNILYSCLSTPINSQSESNYFKWKSRTAIYFENEIGGGNILM